MREEKGVIAVVWKKSGSRWRYAVLQRNKNWEGWELPKGHMEGTPRETLEMELREETGIEDDDIQQVEDLDRSMSWRFEDGDETVKKEYDCFSVRVSGGTGLDTSGNPHNEHSQALFLRFEDTHSLLTYDNQKELLELVHNREPPN
jgi:8-oxo-dGTP pyrophosphatase MutT (NUDIX family)